MALWHENRLTLCSTAAGPAFEGAGITMGMAGKSGAVDHVTVQNGQLAAHVIGDVPPVGICGSGVVDAIACLLETEEIDETGFMENDPATILAPVVLTGSDVRMIQLAKSAIHAGIRTLLHHEKLKCEEITELLIAGGFGSYLDIQNAGKIGLIPEEMLDSVRVVGNAALAGAAMLLLNKGLRKESVRLADSAEVIELSTDPVFAEEYMERMFF